MNPMREIRVEKVVLNMGVGEGGDRLATAERVMEEIAGQKPTRTLAKKTIRDWGIKRGAPIGCKVTLRGEKANRVLDKLLDAVGRKLRKNSFDDHGNFSFGIKEHIDIPGCKYDPQVGMWGLDVCVSLCRPGYRVKYRRRCRKKIPRSHAISREEAMEFVKSKFGVELV
jgi:large subunit ribosomal protein L5